MFTKRPSPTEDGIGFISHEGILKVTADDSSFVPNVVKSYEWSDDGKVLTLTLRKGMKWSDGAPLSTEDLRFWYEDIIMNDELTPAKPKAWATKGGFMELVVIDELTFQLKFKDPYPLVMNQLGHYNGGTMLMPSHYLKQFHITYNEKAGELAKGEGYDHWYQLFGAKQTIYQGSIRCSHDVNVPTLYPYVMTEKTTDYWIFERNPYYWKVDTAGNQLPYIDRVFVQLASNVELIDAKIISGETDFAVFNTSLGNYTMYKKNEGKGGYRVFLWAKPFGAYPTLELNQTYTEDTVLRDLFRDVRFRKAVSVAINRDEINEALFFGKAIPRAMTVARSSAYFKPEFETKYAHYNVDEANAYLDEMGLEWDAKKEWRLRPDGKQLTFTLEYTNIDAGGTIQAILEMVQKYWAKIGIQLILKQQAGELLQERVLGNLIQAGMWTGDKVTDVLFPVDPMWFVGYKLAWGNSWCPLWGQWYTTGGAQGEEPTGEVMENIKRWDTMKETTDPAERIALGQAILEAQSENLWTIGTVGLPPTPVIVRSNLRNVPDQGMTAWDNFWGQSYYPEQRFFKPPLLESQK